MKVTYQGGIEIGASSAVIPAAAGFAEEVVRQGRAISYPFQSQEKCVTHRPIIVLHKTIMGDPQASQPGDKIQVSLIQDGAEFEFGKVFCRQDILTFADVSGDRGEHHVGSGRLMAQGLLVATLVTKIGGDMNYVARAMSMEFLAPVWEGDFALGKIRIEKMLDQPRRKKIEMSCRVVVNGQLVVRGESRGLVWKA